jgi:hypothetical protein
MSLLESLLGPVNYAGDVLDKFGGRAVRGTLAGKPRELLSPIPFSDTLGITDPAEITRGRDLAKQWGLGTGLGGEAAGFGIDIATDPLTYFGGALARKALAKGAEVLPVGWLEKYQRLGGTEAPLARALRAAGNPDSLKILGPPGELNAFAGYKVPPRPKSNVGIESWVKDLADVYRAAVVDENTPVGRLHSLAEAAGVSAFDPADLEGAPFTRLLLRTGPASEYAHYSANTGDIIPNMYHHPKVWLSSGHMQDIQRGMNPLASAGYNLQDYISTHEITHALHHKPWAEKEGLKPFFGWSPESYYNMATGQMEEMMPELAKRLVGPSAFPSTNWRYHEWPKVRYDFPVMSAGTNPQEFVAEVFPAWVNQSLGKLSADPIYGSFDRSVADLYTRLGGPNIPDALLAKLNQYRR